MGGGIGGCSGGGADGGAEGGNAGGSDGGGEQSDTAIVTYGNGVVKALKARAEHSLSCDVIDTPLLSRCPEALPHLLHAKGYEKLLFVDVCRKGAGPLPHFASYLQQHDGDGGHGSSSLLPSRWQLLCAPPTYNPLGRTLTFVSSEAIAGALKDMS